MLATLDQFHRVPRVLRLDMSGQPIRWITWQTAVSLYTRNLVRWTLGESVLRIRGGYSRLDGNRTIVDVNSIVACDGRIFQRDRGQIPPLTNQALFVRDNNTCMYCGQQHSVFNLTRDHIVPRSMGGTDDWTNVVAACKRCNHHKGNRLVEDCGWELLALPYTPNLAEYLALINSGRILGDQMSFLQTQFGNERRKRDAIKEQRARLPN